MALQPLHALLNSNPNLTVCVVADNARSPARSVSLAKQKREREKRFGRRSSSFDEKNRWGTQEGSEELVSMPQPPPLRKPIRQGSETSLEKNPIPGPSIDTKKDETLRLPVRMVSPLVGLVRKRSN